MPPKAPLSSGIKSKNTPLDTLGTLFFRGVYKILPSCRVTKTPYTECAGGQAIYSLPGVFPLRVCWTHALMPFGVARWTRRFRHTTLVLTWGENCARNSRNENVAYGRFVQGSFIECQFIQSVTSILGNMFCLSSWAFSCSFRSVFRNWICEL